jgi:cytosolic iron-sulfur protein assembly protein CIAO1
VVLAVLQGGHGPYEINHVTWCTRYDAGKKEEGEEMVVTTGDDGVVRAWGIEKIIARQEVTLPVLDGKPDEA